jgi:Glyoxalase/Bleomycin resistance protein/Dioxygenase superfamily
VLPNGAVVYQGWPTARRHDAKCATCARISARPLPRGGATARQARPLHLRPERVSRASRRARRCAPCAASSGTRARAWRAPAGRASLGARGGHGCRRDQRRAVATAPGEVRRAAVLFREDVEDAVLGPAKRTAGRADIQPFVLSSPDEPCRRGVQPPPPARPRRDGSDVCAAARRPRAGPDRPHVGGEARELVAKGAAGGWIILSTTDCGKTYDELLAKGVEFTQEPVEHFYGIDCALRDPFGNAIRITQPAQRPLDVPAPTAQTGSG